MNEGAGRWLDEVGAGSATGRAVARFDWTATPLGPPAEWPLELRSLVHLCLSTRFPMLVTWGAELRMIYNDGYRDMIGDLHPAAIGAPLAEVWAEVWDVIGPMADHVLATGRPVWAEHQRLLIERRGFVEETYFTFSYSAIFDADGTTAGLVDIATETTDLVIAQRRLAALSGLGILTFSAPRITDVCVAATNELAGWVDDIVSADVYLCVEDDLVLIASTPQIERTAPDHAVLQEVSTGQSPHVIHGPSKVTGSPPVGVVLPLLGDGHGPAGVLYVQPSPTLPYTADHERFLVAVAASIGGALGAAYARTVEVGEQRHINETLQRAMLQPASDHPTVAARYRPAAANLAVGGDWYDVIDLDEHRRAMVVGDCVGHGLEAATVMGQLRTATRALLLEGHDPATVLERLDLVCPSIPGAFATTVACVVIDRQRATVRYSRAGHLPPLLVDHNGARWLDDATGPPLQTFPGTSRPQATIDYTDDEFLVLYTDGLIERRDEPLDRGFDRLQAAAQHWCRQTTSPQRIADGLLRDLSTTRPEDDVVLVVKHLVIDRPSTA